MVKKHKEHHIEMKKKKKKKTRVIRERLTSCN
jgi:hypothetical protein